MAQKETQPKTLQDNPHKMQYAPLIPLWEDMTYYEHQLVGIHWMLDKEVDGTKTKGPAGKATVYGGLQCDDMGLGKTIQTMAVIKNNPRERTLIVAPLAMLDTWIGVSNRSKFNVYTVGKGGWELTGDNECEHAIYVSNYEKISFRPSLVRDGFDRVILDEAHKIANPSGLNSIMMRDIKAPLRWALTGTPLVNKRRDLVSLFAFLGVPTGKLYRWQPYYEELIPEMMIHRSMESIRGIVADAPPVPIIEHVSLEFSTKEEADFYRGIQGGIAHLLERFRRDILTNQEKFVLLMRLRQLSVHPQVYINAMRRADEDYEMETWSGSVTKINALRDTCSREIPAGSRFIVFCQFIDEMTLIKEVLEEDGHMVEMYYGGLSQKERTEVLKAGADVLLIQLQAGGVGLNLQEYDRVIFMSPWWTSALLDQAIARTVRMGQRKVVRVSFLMLEEEESENIDQLMMDKAETKRELLEEVFEKAFSD